MRKYKFKIGGEFETGHNYVLYDLDIDQLKEVLGWKFTTENDTIIEAHISPRYVHNIRNWLRQMGYLLHIIDHPYPAHGESSMLANSWHTHFGIYTEQGTRLPGDTLLLEQICLGVLSRHQSTESLFVNLISFFIPTMPYYTHLFRSTIDYRADHPARKGYGWQTYFYISEGSKEDWLTYNSGVDTVEVRINEAPPIWALPVWVLVNADDAEIPVIDYSELFKFKLVSFDELEYLDETIYRKIDYYYGGVPPEEDYVYAVQVKPEYYDIFNILIDETIRSIKEDPFINLTISSVEHAIDLLEGWKALVPKKLEKNTVTVEDYRLLIDDILRNDSRYRRTLDELFG